MRILLVDGLRHRLLTGYGALSRHFMLGLADTEGFEVSREDRPGEWEAIEQGSRKLIELLPVGTLKDTDLVLQIRTPGGCRSYSKPSVIYTQNALTDLPDDWIRTLEAADAIVVPTEFDRRVFSRYFDRVSVVPQSANETVFQPRPIYRQEGSSNFTFMFVGTFSYRKGVDILVRAFCEEFRKKEEVELVMYCAGSHRGEEFNRILQWMREYNPWARIRYYANTLSPEWMSRHYNRADAVITCSRGEGWCMPMCEALLCGRPVIAPRSTAMAEYLSPDIATLVPVTERAIADCDEPEASAMRERYSRPGTALFEPSVQDVRRAMREVVANPDAARERAARGRQHLLETGTWAHATRRLAETLRELAPVLDI